ncbi:T9SS type A sorting domain-containing protein [Lutibacter citreus]|uniref:T9SS type A sorting domain-containing protein n=1 Tax=Lutibacter citreus TaxID=2138210 RepID=UPI000DBE2BD7|nr:T9SS type A sorting domain-containing protein [Lutibacter citreus]
MKYTSNILFVLIFIISINSFAKNIYVSKDGNDSNTGTEEKPYLTISKAASVAVAGDIIFIHEGTYEETLKPTNSGSAGNPIIFQSYPGERVIISAMESLSGWTQEGGSIYKTIIEFPDLDQQNFVVNNNTILNLARWPNKTDENSFLISTIRNTGGSGPDVEQGAYLTENTIPGYDWTGGAIFFYGDKPGSGWTAWKRTITSSSSGRVNFNLTFNKNESWVRTFHAPQDLGDFYLEGVKGALDYENEWWFDKSTKELFIQLPNGTPPVDGVVKMRRRLETINLKDKSYIEIRNLAVFGGSINMEDSSTWQSNGNTRTTNNVLYGISSFYGNHTQGISDSSRSGKASINLQGSNNTIEKCEIAFNAASGIQARGNYQTIKNNYIHDFDFISNYDGPLVVRGINDSKILNNTVFNGGRDAIQYFGTNNELAYNDVSRSNLLADDCGLFYTTGAQYTTEIHHNWFHDAASTGDKKKAAGIYLDNDAAGFNVHHNVIWNTEWSNIQINWNGKDINVYNNTLWNGSAVMGAWHKDGTSFSNVNVWNNLSDKDSWEPQSDKQNNLTETSVVFRDFDNSDFYLKADSNPIDQGKEITGITDNYVANAPDVGAYEYGGDDWSAGITWNPDYGAADLGCYGLPGEDCINLPQNDEDKDGVADAFDNCPGTPVGTPVNASGCKYFSLPATNFTVFVQGEECTNSNNGAITITSADTSLSFTATIEQSSTSKDFTSSVKFENLNAGNYTVCITTTASDDYKQCFNVTIDQPAALKVNTKINEEKQQVSIQLKGGNTYRIKLNDFVTKTDKSEITLDLNYGSNKLMITTDKDCQGKHDQNIQLFDTPTIYPTVVDDYLNISFPISINENINIKIIDPSGKLIVNTSKKIQNNYTTIDVSGLNSGLYIVKIVSPTTNFNSKIIKQ